MVSAILLLEDAANGGDEVACEVARRWIGNDSECGMNEESSEKAIVWNFQLVFGGGGSSEAISEALMTLSSKAISVEGGDASIII